MSDTYIISNQSDPIVLVVAQRGPSGRNAYQVWLAEGNTGSEQDFLDSLKGDKGDEGDAGASAYQVWLVEGNTGSEQDFLDSLKGDKGDEGDAGASAYQVWLDSGHSGTIEEYLASLQGNAGPGVPVGGSTGQVLAKTTSADYATGWVTPLSLTGLFISIPLFPGNGIITITPSGASTFPAVMNGTVKSQVNLALFTQARIHIRCNYTGTGHDVGLQYSADGATNWIGLDNSNGPRKTITNIGTNTITSSWVTLHSAARGDVFIRPVHGNGTAATLTVYAIDIQLMI